VLLVLLMLYLFLDAPWCFHCIDLAKQWKKAAKTVKLKMPSVKLAKIDGDENQNLVEEMNIQGYPGIIFTMNNGTRTLTYDGKTRMARAVATVAKY